MKTRKLAEKRKLKRQEKKREKFYNYVFIALLILWIVYYVFIQPKTIGGDYRYNLYIFWLPTLTGILALGFYKRKFIIEAINEKKKIISKIIAILFLFLMASFWSFLSIGQITNIIFHTINKEVAKSENAEIQRLDIKQIVKSKSKGSTEYKIWFKFHNRTEKINIDRETFERYKNENLNNYQIKLELQKGIWDHYLLKDWQILKK